MVKPTDYILDCSTTMAWCFEDEVTPYTETMLTHLNHCSAHVPSIWYLEVANVLLFAEKKGRITKVKASGFIETLRMLPILHDDNAELAMSTTLEIARESSLTIYDASYLELALRLNKPLATLDKALRHAAKQCKVAVMA